MYTTSFFYDYFCQNPAVMMESVTGVFLLCVICVCLRQWLPQAQLAQTGYITRSVASAWLPGRLTVDLRLKYTLVQTCLITCMPAHTRHRPVQMVLVLQQVLVYAYLS